MFRFEETTRAYLRFSIETPATLTDEADITILRNSFKMRAINNDTRHEFNPVFFDPLTETFSPNKHGYTIMVESVSEKPIPKVRWGLNVLSKPEFPLANVGDGENAHLNTLKQAAEISAPVVLKKNNILFRYFIVAPPGDHALSVDLSLQGIDPSLGAVELELQEDRRTILKNTGILAVRFPFAFTMQTESSPQSKGIDGPDTPGSNGLLSPAQHTSPAEYSSPHGRASPAIAQSPSLPFSPLSAGARASDAARPGSSRFVLPPIKRTSSAIVRAPSDDVSQISATYLNFLEIMP